MSWHASAGCRGKVVYLTFTHAAQAAGRMKRRRKVKRGLRVYRCRFCQHFHLTGKR